ncbi:MAG: hypothetical protein M4579_000202 [Chaenotheca gracillima]|nr:MAG: hypothetical protein M4579_000202 [Chaenotheca gracillima]
MPHHDPTISDVLEVRSSFSTLSSRLRLPPELVDLVLDYASYWPHTVTSTKKALKASGGHSNGGGQEGHANKICLTTPPLGLPLPPSVDGDDLAESTSGSVQEWIPPRGEHPCRKIVFELSSHDQGFGGPVSDRGTYKSSWTWFDAVVAPPPSLKPIPQHLKTKSAESDIESDIESDVCDEHDTDGEEQDAAPKKDKHPFLPPSTRVQANALGTQQTRHHIVTWSADDNGEVDGEAGDEANENGRGRETVDGKFVRDLKIGDTIQLWARARFPAWSNSVEKASVRVYWAI